MLIMIVIGLRFIGNPIHAASPSGVTLSTPEALTDTRVVGALALTIAFIIATYVVSRRRLRAGHATVVALMALILAVRMFGFAEDGTTLAMGDQKVKATGEIVFLMLNALGSPYKPISASKRGDAMRTVVITGANAGIGFATAKFIAALPDWHVLLACRNELKAEAAVDAIRQTYPDAHVGFVPLDLFSLSSVRRLPAVLAAMPIPPLGGLILNAGGVNMKAKSLEFTEDGFERTFQLNFLGHFLLTHLLIQQMTVPARIIFVSSDLHDPAATKMGSILPLRYGPVEDLAHGTGTAARLKPMARYGTAKMYAMMTAYELDRKLRAMHKPITVNSWSPGVVPTTQAGRDMNPIMKKIITSRWFVNFMGSHLSTEEEAAKALGGLLIDGKYSGVSGRYFDGFKEIPSSAESRNESKARAVWEQSIQLAELTRAEAEALPVVVVGHSTHRPSWKMDWR